MMMNPPCIIIIITIMSTFEHGGSSQKRDGPKDHFFCIAGQHGNEPFSHPSRISHFPFPISHPLSLTLSLSLCRWNWIDIRYTCLLNLLLLHSNSWWLLIRGHVVLNPSLSFSHHCTQRPFFSMQLSALRNQDWYLFIIVIIVIAVIFFLSFKYSSS